MQIRPSQRHVPDKVASVRVRPLRRVDVRRRSTITDSGCDSLRETSPARPRIGYDSLMIDENAMRARYARHQ